MTIGSKIPSVPKVYTKEELAIKEELVKFKDSYIFVNTNFKRKSESIWLLGACQSQRNISLNKSNLIFKSNDEILTIISDIIKKHYKDTKGKIGIWGNIEDYIYYHKDNQIYTFDTNGNQIHKK
ncbi:MAG: hypothetical protein DRG78_01000 [Epsilonproteobacteria bacterium]|nr:MAG: hypothetical protein DRG78_01000 [Campylobacterota bacterium]